MPAGFVLRALVYRSLGGRGARQLTRLVFSPHQAPAGVAEGFAYMARNFNARTGKLPLFTDAQLRRLTMPVLLLGGDQDAILDVIRIRERLSRLLPHLDSEITPGAGHVLLNTAERAVAFLAPAHKVSASSAS